MIDASSASFFCFGPYRALLRVLVLRKPAVMTALFMRYPEMSQSVLLVSQTYVKHAFLSEFLACAEQCMCSEPELALEASLLFQVHDLGERGWLLSSAPDLSRLLSILRRIFPNLSWVTQKSETEVLCRWTPDESLPPLLIHYAVGIGLSYLAGQGLSQDAFLKIVLPKGFEPSGEKQITPLRDFFIRHFKTSPSFAGQTVEFLFKTEVLHDRFKSADDSIFQFFLQRRFRADNQKSDSELNDVRSELYSKVRNLLLSNLASSEYGISDIARQLGVSTRTLERALANEKISLRQLKQKLQREAAEELLFMGFRAKEVAAQVGFQDLASFSRAFNKWTGSTPSRMRKRKQNAKS